MLLRLDLYVRQLVNYRLLDLAAAEEAAIGGVELVGRVQDRELERLLAHAQHPEHEGADGLLESPGQAVLLHHYSLIFI